MILIALKMLTGDRLKYLGLVFGLAFASLLIVQQAAIYNGFAKQAGAWIRDTGGFDLWVMDPQVEFCDDPKPVDDNELNRVRSVEGVAWAVPMYKNFMRTRLPDGTQVGMRIVGLDDATLVGGPPEMVQGTLDMLRQDKAVIIDETQRFTTMRLREPVQGQPPRELRVGDRIDINDHEAVIVGTYRRSQDFFWDPVIFTTFSKARYMAPRERKTTNYICVKVAAGFEPNDVAARIRSVTKLAAYTPEKFDAMTRGFILDRTGININFGITVLLGFVIGMLVSALLLFLFTSENLRYFGTLKAMGADHSQIITMMSMQILLVGAMGFGLGAGGAAMMGKLLGRLDLAFDLSWPVLAAAASGVMVCCAVGGAASIYRVLKLEPAIVFRS